MLSTNNPSSPVNFRRSLYSVYWLKIYCNKYYVILLYSPSFPTSTLHVNMFFNFMRICSRLMWKWDFASGTSNVFRKFDDGAYHSRCSIIFMCWWVTCMGFLYACMSRNYSRIISLLYRKNDLKLVTSCSKKNLYDKKS